MNNEEKTKNNMKTFAVLITSSDGKTLISNHDESGDSIVSIIQLYESLGQLPKGQIIKAIVEKTEHYTPIEAKDFDNGTIKEMNSDFNVDLYEQILCM
jgi:hypothetical protein